MVATVAYPLGHLDSSVVAGPRDGGRARTKRTVAFYLGLRARRVPRRPGRGALQIPRETVNLQMDLSILVEAFVVVVVGGLAR